MRITYLLPALFSAATLLSGTAAVAQQTAPAAATTNAEAPAAKPKEEKKVCRRDENSFSRMAGRICKTQAEWNADSRRSSNDPKASTH